MLSVEIEQLERLLGGVNEGVGSWLAGRRIRHEDLAPGVSFAGLEKKYAEAERKASGTTATASRVFSNDTLKRLCPPIELVGVGSSREAYACFGGRCLKLALTRAGRAQNKAEMVNAGPYVLKKDYGCFSQAYAIGADGWLLLTECCVSAQDPEKLARDLGFSSWTAVGVLMRAVQHIGFDFGAQDAAELAGKGATASSPAAAKRLHTELLDAAREASAVCHAASAGNPGEKHETLMQLLDFWKKYGIQRLLPADLVDHANWGYAIRNDKIRPVVIDSGFSGEVAERYYR